MGFGALVKKYAGLSHPAAAALPIMMLAFALLPLIAGCEGLGSFGAPSERTESRDPAEEEAENEPPKTATEGSTYIGPNGGIVDFGGCRLSVPHGLLRDKEYFTIRFPEEQDEDVITGTNYVIIPHGKTFDRPALLEIEYDPSNLIEGVNAEDLVAAVFVDGVWQELGKSRVDTDRHIVASPVTFIGSFGLVERSESRIKLNTPPEAVIETADLPLDNGRLKILYDASGSADSDGKIVRYDWDFDCDGVFDYTGRGKDADASYIFPQVGKYTTVLKVTDDNRNPASTISTVVVEVDELFPPDPPGKLDINITTFPPTGKVPITIDFAASAVGGLGPYIILWDFGGSVTSDIFNPSMTFKKAGKEKILVYLSDQSGQEIAREITLNLKGSEAPSGDTGQFAISLVESKSEGRAPLTVDFTLKFKNAKEPVRWKALFGDEREDALPVMGEGKTITHTFNRAGMYLVDIIATDANQNVDSAFTLIKVAPTDTRDVPVEGEESAAGFYEARRGRIKAVAMVSEDDPMTLSFELAGFSGDDHDFISWNFGDGYHSNETAPTHTYTREGVYEAAVEYHEYGAKKIRRIWIPASKSPAVAVQMPSDVKGLAPFEVSPAAVVTGIKGDVHYAWDFGDGETSADTEPCHVYTEPGNFSLKLEVSDAEGEMSASSDIVTITVLPKAVRFDKPVAYLNDVKAEGGQVARVLRLGGLDGVQSYEIPAEPVADRAFAPVLSSGCGFVGYATSDGIEVRETGSGRVSYEYTPVEGVVTGVFISRFGDRVFINLEKESGRGVAYCHSVESGMVSVTPDGVSARIAGITQDGYQFLLLSEENDSQCSMSLVTWNDEAGVWDEPVKIADAVGEGAISSDGSMILALMNDRSIFEFSSWKEEPAEICGTPRGKRALAVSDDGDTAAWLEDSGSDAWDIMIARRNDDDRFVFENLTSLVSIKAESLSIVPDGSALVVYAIHDVPAEPNGEGDSPKKESGLFAINLLAEEPEVSFLCEALPEFAAGVSLRHGAGG